MGFGDGTSDVVGLCIFVTGVDETGVALYDTATGLLGHALHSQVVQRTAYRLLANIDATMERRRREPSARRWLKLPWRGCGPRR